MAVSYTHLYLNSQMVPCSTVRQMSEERPNVLDLPNYAPEECPICKEGKLPLVHLGSRKMKEAAKQTL